MTPPRGLYSPSLTVRLGIAGHAMLAFLVPMTFCLVIAPLTRSGFDVFVDGLIGAMAVAAPSIVITPLALIKRPRWGRTWSAAVCTLLLVGWAGTLAFALGYPLGLLHARTDTDGSSITFAWTGIVFLLVMALPAWWVLRLLRDPAVRG